MLYPNLCQLPPYLIDQPGIQASEVDHRFGYHAAVHGNDIACHADQFEGIGVIKSVAGDVQVMVVIFLDTLETEKIVVVAGNESRYFRRVGLYSAAMGGDDGDIAGAIDKVNPEVALVPTQLLKILILIQFPTRMHNHFLLLTKAKITD